MPTWSRTSCRSRSRPPRARARFASAGSHRARTSPRSSSRRLSSQSRSTAATRYLCSQACSSSWSSRRAARRRIRWSASAWYLRQATCARGRPGRRDPLGRVAALRVRPVQPVQVVPLVQLAPRVRPAQMVRPESRDRLDPPARLAPRAPPALPDLRGLRARLAPMALKDLPALLGPRVRLALRALRVQLDRPALPDPAALARLDRQALPETLAQRAQLVRPVQLVRQGLRARQEPCGSARPACLRHRLASTAIMPSTRTTATSTRRSPARGHCRETFSDPRARRALPAQRAEPVRRDQPAARDPPVLLVHRVRLARPVPLG